MTPGVASPVSTPGVMLSKTMLTLFEECHEHEQTNQTSSYQAAESHNHFSIHNTGFVFYYDLECLLCDFCKSKNTVFAVFSLCTCHFFEDKSREFIFRMQK